MLRRWPCGCVGYCHTPHSLTIYFIAPCQPSDKHAVTLYPRDATTLTQNEAIDLLSELIRLANIGREHAK